MDERTESRDPAARTGSRWVRCPGCGRQFRVEADQGREPQYCPTCDYRRARKRLGQLNHDHASETEEDPQD